jgi:hypothetical protein
MEALHAIAAEEAERHEDDIDAAVDAVLKRGRRLPEYPTFADGLIRNSIRHMIHDVRHAMNTAMKKANGQYGGPAIVTAGSATAAVARSVYSYMIAGKSLGSILGEELEKIAADEESRASGHQFNAKLCRALAPLVKPEKTVRECVREARLRKVFEAVE